MNNFITNIINNDINNGLDIKKIKFRFPPEPNGVLHLGHIKALYINFYLAKKYNAKINLRFEDTNPINIKYKYINNIINNLKWLNFKYNNITYVSDYFNILYKLAKILIIKKKAYIQIFKNNKLYNINNIEHNLHIFHNMKYGKYNKNYILKAKINNINTNNYYINNPIMYRIINYKHFRTKYNWNIFPTYDWSHGQSDYIENITHSLCSTEFIIHKNIYNWYLNNIYNKNFNKILPKQIEFSRLNINNTITSKRKINILIKKKIINNLCDPRLLTINSFIKKGYSNKYLIDFIKVIGYSKRNNNININLLNNIIKNNLIKKSIKLMVIIKPFKIIIKNFKNNYIKWIYLKEYNKIIPFTKYIYIEKKDFKIKNYNNFYRLCINNYVRLKYSYIIKIDNITKNNNNYNIYCSIYNNNKINKNNIKSTIQWISNKYYLKIKIILYDYIFINNNKIYNKKIKILNAYSNIIIENIKINKIYQFHRIGFFYFYKYINKIYYFKKIILFNNKNNLY
ncbi:MAG: hypothetical protein RDO_1310 [Flavobacteriales endosymbiont of Rhyzopertha dominica]|nr:MAG: glutamate--tRNA ligase family protein [Candidatus Shikimatogenerans bostrichidophilus]